MELKTFKVGDIITQKNDKNIKWVILSIDKENNSVELCRKGGYFNDMITKFNGDNTQFEPAGRTEKRIKREAKINTRQKNQEDFEKNKYSLKPTEEFVVKQIRPKEVAVMANCSVKTVLEAIHSQKLSAQLSGKKTGRGVRYLIKEIDALDWASQYQPKPVETNNMPDKIYLTVKEIASQTSLSEATIRNEIKNGNLKADNANPNGKIPRYISHIEWVEEWSLGKTNKPRAEVKFEGVTINPKNNFSPGSKMYGYFEVFLKNNNQATYQQLVDGCISEMKNFGVRETLNNIKKDLNNKLHHWQVGRLGLKVDLDKTQCKVGPKGRICHGELNKVVVIVKEVVGES